MVTHLQGLEWDRVKSVRVWLEDGEDIEDPAVFDEGFDSLEESIRDAVFYVNIRNSYGFFDTPEVVRSIKAKIKVEEGEVLTQFAVNTNHVGHTELF